MTIQNCLLAGVALVATTGVTAGAGAQSQRARQGPQTPAPVRGPIVQPSSTFPLKQVGYIKASNPSERAQFGDAVALSWFGLRLALSGDGDTLAVSAANEDGGARGINGRQDDRSAPDAGAVYLFTRTGATWTFQSYLKGSNTEKFDEFGSGVALSRHGTLAVGARMEDSGSKGANGNGDDNSVTDSGAVYLFSY